MQSKQWFTWISWNHSYQSIIEHFLTVWYHGCQKPRGIWSFHGTKDVGCGLGCDTPKSCMWLSVFQRYITTYKASFQVLMRMNLKIVAETQLLSNSPPQIILRSFPGHHEEQATWDKLRVANIIICKQTYQEGLKHANVWTKGCNKLAL